MDRKSSQAIRPDNLQAESKEVAKRRVCPALPDIPNFLCPTEYTYDAQILKDWFLEQLSHLSNVKIICRHKPERIKEAGGYGW